jgi:hypothetical protein
MFNYFKQSKTENVEYGITICGDATTETRGPGGRYSEGAIGMWGPDQE